uniref:2OGFeDO JBP1/TET oxygenase domain-containing protein n=1 Tax=viral metagenome TaxID=1070528 RepID=A0A6C0C7N2_9ZZZZ
MVNKVLVNKLLTDKQMKDLEGTWVDESFIKIPVLEKNTDVYYIDEETGLEKLLLKFRKNVISDNEIRLGWNAYKDLAKPSRGRGASAGPIDTTGQYWSKRTVVNNKKWMTNYLTPKGEVSKMKVNNQVASNPIGFFDADNKMCKLPCRLTHFTRTNFEKYQEGFPFLQKIDKLYKQLTPEAYQRQLDRANKKPLFKIPDTSFSTVTINRNFRTALHRDAGDYREGFGNLTVIERGKYHGGYTVFPQFGVGINLRNNDFVAMDVHQWHANTQMYETGEDKAYNEAIPKVYKDNPDVGTAGIYELYTRISFVCYLREKLIHCSDDVDPQFLTKSGHNKIIVE